MCSREYVIAAGGYVLGVEDGEELNRGANDTKVA